MFLLHVLTRQEFRHAWVVLCIDFGSCRNKQKHVAGLLCESLDAWLVLLLVHDAAYLLPTCCFLCKLALAP